MDCSAFGMLVCEVNIASRCDAVLDGSHTYMHDAAQTYEGSTGDAKGRVLATKCFQRESNDIFNRQGADE